MSKHTPEPWVTEPGGGKGAWIKGSDGEWSALSCGGSDENAMSNARRIVACVNICEGIPTESIEEHINLFDAEADAVNKIAAQRDALLAALEQCAASMEGDKLYVNTLAYAQRAIAAAKAGAV